MTPERFGQLTEEIIVEIRRRLLSKGKEYSRRGDRLHNFKTAAKMEARQETPERALWGMKKKHMVSIIDMIDELDSGIIPTVEMLEEKIIDDIDYLFLLMGLFVERIEAE